MARLIFEIEDSVIAKAFAEAFAQSTQVNVASDKPPKKIKKADLETLKDKLIELSSKKEVNKLLKDAYGTTSVSKIEEDDYSALQKLLQKELDALEEEEDEDEDEDEDEKEDDEDEEDEDEDEEINADTVKAMYEAFVKENGKKIGKKLLAEFDIKTAKGIGKLKQKKLEELYGEMCE